MSEKKAVAHDEARAICMRFINGHFDNKGREHPRISIPADENRDDDILIGRYIDQQEANGHYVEACEEVEKALEEAKQFIPTRKPEQGPLPEWIIGIGIRVDAALSKLKQAKGEV